MPYYDYNRIIQIQDVNKKRPELFIINSNRSTGKTTGMLKLALDYYKGYKKCPWMDGTRLKHIVLQRDVGTMQNIHKNYEDLLCLYPKYGRKIETRTLIRDLINEIYLDNNLIGFVLPLKKYRKLKEKSPLFKDVCLSYMDEYQVFDNEYIKNEPHALTQLVITIGRGGGKQVRYCPVFLLGNYVSPCNPYFSKLGITKRLTPEVKLMKGDGWICDFYYDEELEKKMIETHGILRAFGSDNAEIGKTYLNDTTLIDGKYGKNRYLFTLYDGTFYGIRESLENGNIYVTDKPDPLYPIKFHIGEESPDTSSSIQFQKKTFAYRLIKDAYDRGILRFSDYDCRNSIYQLIAERTFFN